MSTISRAIAVAEENADAFDRLADQGGNTIYDANHARLLADAHRLIAGDLAQR